MKKSFGNGERERDTPLSVPCHSGTYKDDVGKVVELTAQPEKKN